MGEPTTVTLTATATHDVRGDIIDRMGLIDPAIVITGFDRPNLAYESRRVSKMAEKAAELYSLWEKEPGTGIVYCSTRKAVDEVTSLLSSRFRDRPVFAYHAGMDAAARTGNQERFMETPSAIAVATNAFGMGINKPDVRLVVHFNVPGTLEAYYQEAGRAGRDGLPARCVMLFSYQDRLTQEFFIKKIGEDQQNSDYAAIEKLKAHATRKLEAVIRYAQTHSCRRRMILDYFGDDAKVDGCNCDVCQAAHGGAMVSIGGPVVSDETTTVVRQLLSAVARLNRKFGVGMIADVLAGTDSERTQKWGLKSLSVFGLLKSYNTKRIIAMLHRLMESGLARQRSVDGEKHITVVELTTAGAAVMKGDVPPPTTLVDIIPAHQPPAFRERTRGTPNTVPGQIPATDEYEPMSRRSAAAVEDVQVDPESQARFEKLRAVRLSIAREKGVPPYVVCHDSVLRTIAICVPADLETLQRIKGMGPHKVATYGQALLNAVLG